MSITRFVRETFGQRLERTETSDFNSLAFEAQVGDFWDNLASVAGVSSPRLVERVWVANRCQHATADAISTMPLRHFGGREPAWVSNPDPAWYPGGVTDAMYAIVWSMLGWGDAFLYITDRYANGYPSAWTVLDPAPMDVTVVRGERRYRSGQVQLNEDNVVQITRNPTTAVRGTSVIAAASSYTNGLLAASDLGRVMMGTGGTPNAVIRMKYKQTAESAAAVQEMWMSRAAARRGAPAVIGPDVEDFKVLAFSPADMLLLDTQTYNAQVIAAMYGMPAQLVNLPLEGGLNYQTPILALEQWWRAALHPLAKRITDNIGAQMLPKGQYIEHDSRTFLAPSLKEQAEVWQILIAMGAATPEEARVTILKLPPEQPALEDLGTPPTSAGASPAQQPSNVTTLRPTSSGSTF